MSYGLACQALVCRHHCTSSPSKGLHCVQHVPQPSESRPHQQRHALHRRRCDVVCSTRSCAAGSFGLRSRRAVTAVAAAAAAAPLPDDAAEPSSAQSSNRETASVSSVRFVA